VSVLFANILLTTPQAFSLCEAGSVPQCSTIDQSKDLESMLIGVSCLRANFVEERIVTNISKPLSLKGNLLVVRGVGIVLQQQTPVILTTAIGQQGVFEFDKQVSHFPADLQNTLVSLFSLQMNALVESFSVRHTSVGNQYLIKLLPTNRSLRSAISEVNLKGQCYPETISILQTNGESKTFTLSDIIWGPFEISNAEKKALQLAAAS